MAERYITLVRHGKHDHGNNEPGGGDLLPEGIEQAQMVANIISQHYPVTHVYSSTLRRAISTAQIIKAQLQPHIGLSFNEDLCEAVFHIPSDHEDFFAHFENLNPERITAHRIRVAHAYDTHTRPVDGTTNEHDILVCHGNVIRYFVMRAMDAPIELWANLTMYNGGITRLVVNEKGHTRVITHNEVSHLPYHLWTAT